MFILFSLSLVVSTVAPCESADTTRHLAPVEVSASAVGERAVPTHQQWSTSKHEWQRQGAVQLTDVLRRLPGVQLRDYGGAGAQVSVSARGLGAAHTVITLDGFPLTDYASGSVDVGQFRLGDFSQMVWTVADEPTLLTSVRSLGTSHLALVSAQQVPCVGVEWGSFGQFSAEGAAQHRSGAHTLGAKASFARADNDFPYRVVNGSTYDYGRRPRSPWQRYQGMAHWQWQTAGRTTQVRLWHQQHTQTLPGAVTLYTTNEGEDLRRQQTLVQGSHAAHHDRWAWRWAGQYAHRQLHYSDRGEEYPEGLHEEVYRQQEAWSTLGATYALSPTWHLAYAADATHTRLCSNVGRFDEVARTALQQSFSLRMVCPTTMLTLRTLRHDYFHHVAGQGKASAPLMPWESSTVAANAHRWTWSVAVSQRLWRTMNTRGTLRGVVQTLFRMPSFTENYYHRWGNANLRPERTQQFSVGMMVENGSASSAVAWQVSVDAYANRVKDRILGIPVNQTVWRTTNLDCVHAFGIDLSTQLRWKLARGHELSWVGNASLQRVADESDANAATYGLQLPYVPEFTAHAVVMWSNPFVDISLTSDFSSERHATANHYPAARLAPYGTLNAAVGRTFRFGRQTWHTQLVVNNLTHTHYELVRGYPLPGRSVMWRNEWAF